MTRDRSRRKKSFMSAQRSVIMQTKTRVCKVRWGIATILGIGIIINYFDRVNLSVATTSLVQDFHFTDTDIGLLLSAYLWSYTLLQIPVGAILDRIGVKWIMRVGIIVWS